MAVPSFIEAVTSLQRLNRERPRVQPEEIVATSTAPSFNPNGQLNPQGALRSIYARFDSIAAALTSAEPLVAAANVVYVSKNANDPFGGSIQRAIDSIAEQAGPDNRFLINIVSPGVYRENVALPEFVYLVSLSAGPNPTVVIESASGDTLQIPERHSGIQGITIRSVSPVPTDAAVRVVAASPGDEESTIFVLTWIQSFNAARGLACTPTCTDPVIGIFVVVEGMEDTVSVLADLQGGGLIALGGSIQQSSDATVQIGPGALCFLQNMLIGASAHSGGFLVDSDGGFFAANLVTVFGGSNGVRIRNGGFAFLIDVNAFGGGIAGPTTLEIDAVSIAYVDDFKLRPLDDFYSGFTIAGTVLFPGTSMFQVGTLTPDTRPLTPAPGMRFYVTDPGPLPHGRQLTFIPDGIGWVDQNDTPVP